MNEFDKLKKQAERYRTMYPKGTRIELTHMGNDPRPIPDGTRGTVEAVDDIGTLHCKFDNGRSLGIVPGEDSFRRLSQEELMEEISERRMEQYIGRINREVLPQITWSELQNPEAQTNLLKMLHEKFAETYGTAELDRDMGFVMVPGVVETADRRRYVVLLELDTASSGEHWGTDFFTPKGILSDREDSGKVRALLKNGYPYTYWYTPTYTDDIHVNRKSCPDEVKAMLKTATAVEPEKTNEVKFE